jgi:dienelactone hydrolase
MIEVKPELFKNALAYSLPDMGKVKVQNVVYRSVGDTPLMMDIYHPPNTEADACLPVVVFIMGYADSAARRLVGSPLKDTPQITSWGRLTAASGLVAVTYQTQRSDDVKVVAEYIRENGASLNMDSDRIGIWSCSANSPTAVSFAMQDDRRYVRFAVFYYGLMLTPDDRFREEINTLCERRGCYAAELKDFRRLRKDLPLLIVRAGRDDVPFVNESIDHFVRMATARDVPITLVDYQDGVHAFDVQQKNERSSEIIEQTVAFFRAHLGIE